MKWRQLDGMRSLRAAVAETDEQTGERPVAIVMDGQDFTRLLAPLERFQYTPAKGLSAFDGIPVMLLEDSSVRGRFAMIERPTVATVDRDD